MKVLIAGAGKISRELIRRLGETWEISLIEKFEERLQQTVAYYPYIHEARPGDASSPVVLEEAGLSEQDYVLALTDNDQVNLAVCTFAREKGVKYVLARVHDPDQAPAFEKLKVKVMLINSIVAKTIYQYLEDPRISYTPLSLVDGEVLEIAVTKGHWLVGRSGYFLDLDNWRLAAIARDGELIFPSPQTTIQTGDHLVVIGEPESFKPICRLYDFCQPHFPAPYGQGLLVVPLRQEESAQDRILTEGFELALNIKIKTTTVLITPAQAGLEERIKAMVQGLEVEVETAEDEIWDSIYELCGEKNIGLVVIPPFESQFLKALVRPKLTTLAHSLPCPLLVARSTHPYKKILVPFNASPRAENALETALDLARQTEAEVTAVVVEEADFIHGSQEEDWSEAMFTRVRDMAHPHKIKVHEEERKGNPVREITELSKDYDLMIVGSGARGAGLFAPNVGELITTKAACSVMLIAS